MTSHPVWLGCYLSQQNRLLGLAKKTNLLLPAVDRVAHRSMKRFVLIDIETFVGIFLEWDQKISISVQTKNRWENEFQFTFRYMTFYKPITFYILLASGPPPCLPFGFEEAFKERWGIQGGKWGIQGGKFSVQTNEALKEGNFWFWKFLVQKISVFFFLNFEF